ncbi:transposase IS116/IS110/IS902 family [Mycolicibacterium chubuense NBB4]|uniref:Transposase IS116/IS110/IS902 family n=1 Tax=Mycolicibacterium chubuense (strain NBB4) TaxID=710421 RepID=I4BNN0_MYCCN|nr:IS110 family transposase [Mycolicibacterium chubuense]AFM16213.1 transposase IS116/IS110/IS902 family [Mycolicibacterium chubuense NBB4]AFM18837.1 transposase IS116/IS110/IS902 family [Mycolicibacterium chubuense NBB4]AFM18887.1 transposase IS116/IS110/IS902 family [Mycolicibacterium chubuense NBB4]
MIFVGDDWAEDHHDVYLMDEAGQRLAARRLPEGLSGIRALHELIAVHADQPDQVLVGIETDRGLWVSALAAAGYQVWAINPMAAARYRDRHHVAGAKSDAADAKLLADLVRTDRHNHRQIAGDSPDAEAIKVLARSHQSLIWARTRHANMLRSALREYYPAALEAFDALTDGDALAILGRAPTPEQGAQLSLAKIGSALKAAGRQRNIEARAAEIQAVLRRKHLTAPPAVAAAFGATTTAAVHVIAALNTQIADLETALADHFETHPDADIYRSLPGLGVVLGARVLGEFGDDPNRFTTAKCRKNYAGTSPLTIASGRKRAVLARHVRNKRLYDAIDQWAFCALLRSPGARTYYDEHRAAGDTHHQALRALGNRLVGVLHGCLRHHTRYEEHKAWAHRQTAAA